MDITRLSLNGKPAPDAFLEAARRLKVEPSRAVVVEDAIAGVEAGRAGAFGCVIGVDRSGQSQALREAGADVVVTDLAQVKIAAEPPSAWSLVYEGFDPAREGIREALCALGNGYFATRGAATWARADDIHYPGTYLACGYNRMRTDIAGRVVENEDLVNLPNWLALEFRIGDEDWFDLQNSQDPVLPPGARSPARHAVCEPSRFEDRPGAAHYAQGAPPGLDERHASGRAGAGADCRELVRQGHGAFGDRRPRRQWRREALSKFNNKHLEPLAGEAVGEDGVYLLVRTCQSKIHVAQAARTQAFVDGQLRTGPRRVIDEPGYIGQELVDRPPAGRDLGAGKARFFLYLARSGDLGVRPGGAQGDRTRGPLRRGDGGSCAYLEALVAPFRRAYPAGRTGIQAERADAAAVEHVSSAAGGVAQLHRARYRRAGARLDRRGLPGPHLLG